MFLARGHHVLQKTTRTIQVRLDTIMMYFAKYFLVPRPLYPASSRLLSVPPRYYDIIDTDTNEVIDSDLHRRANRSRSVARNSELRDGWRHPGYNDLVVGSKAHPGNYYPR